MRKVSARIGARLSLPPSFPCLMGIFPSIRDRSRFLQFPMKPVVLISLLFLGYGVAPLRAGSVVSMANGLEVTGKVTFTPSAIHVESGSFPTDISLSEVLEADFTDTPFQLDYFATHAGQTGPLPSNWKGQDFGTVTT